MNNLLLRIPPHLDKCCSPHRLSTVRRQPVTTSMSYVEMVFSEETKDARREEIWANLDKYCSLDTEVWSTLWGGAENPCRQHNDG